MKRTVVSLIIILISLTMYAQKEYVVYDCSPSVRVFRVDSRTWEPLCKGEALLGNDILNIREKGTVKILDNSTRRIYNNVKAGKQSVSSVVKASSKSSNSVFGNLNRQLANNVKNSDHREKYYSTYGAAMRGYEDNLTFTDSLYYAIYNGINNQIPSEQLKLQETINPDGSVSFSVVNYSEDIYYVTLLYGDNSCLEVCFDSDNLRTNVIPISPHSTVDFRSFRFSPSTDNRNYYLLASRREFWTEPLQNALRYMMQPDFEADSGFVLVIQAS